MERADLIRALDFVETWIRAKVSGEELPSPPEDPVFQERRGLFVTLRVDGELRGCIGRVEPFRPMARELVEMAAHALEDPRFLDLPLTRAELDRLAVEITFLSEPHEIQGPQDFVVGRDGLMISVGGRTGVYLPQVAEEQGWNPVQTLESCCRSKMNLPAGAWKLPEARLYAFEGQKVSRVDRKA